MIRKFKAEDETKILTMWVKANFRVNDFIERDFWIENFNEMKDKIINNETYIYEYDGEIQGFVNIINNCEITAIVTKEDSLKQGIGRKLINYCKEKKENLNIKVYENNVAGVVFILRMEFKNIGVHIDEKTAEKEYILEWRR